MNLVEILTFTEGLEKLWTQVQEKKISYKSWIFFHGKGLSILLERMWIIVHKLNLVHQSLSGKELEYEPAGNLVVHRGTGKTMNMRFGKNNSRSSKYFKK